jgi:hypothetical protein
MARRSAKRWPKGSRYATRRPRKRGGPGAGPIVAVLLLVAAGIWFVPRMTGHGTKGRAVVPAGAQALADSTDAATRRGEWDAALTYALELSNAAPNLSGAQRKLAIAWHNYGTGFRTVHGVPRSARRTSIDKIECEIRALSAADSARALAANDEEWAAAGEVYGKTLEYLGLPIDALSIYSQILQRKPDHRGAAQRLAYLRDRLKNPLLDE